MASRIKWRVSMVLTMLLTGSFAARSATMSMKDAQEALHSKGYLSGTADGKYGPQTKAALERYQKEQGLTVTGRLDTATMNRLSGATTSEAAGSVKGAAKEATSVAKPSTDSAGVTAAVKDAGSSGKKESKSAWKEMKGAVGKK